jgi:hypothetical protein
MSRLSFLVVSMAVGFVAGVMYAEYQEKERKRKAHEDYVNDPEYIAIQQDRRKLYEEHGWLYMIEDEETDAYHE